MIPEPALEDARATDPVERLLEDSWQGRSLQITRRERLVEAAAALLFMACALPLALAALSTHSVDPALAVELVVLYAIASRLIKFPLGAGYVVPSYLVLVPMLLLLPPGLVPLLTAAGLVLGTAAQALSGQVRPERVLLSIPDAWHSLGPAVVLLLLAGGQSGAALLWVYLAAFAAGCLVDLASATVREAAILGIAPRLQIRVVAVVWLIDACLAPLGVLVAHAARHDGSQLLLIVPLYALLLLVSRDRNTRIDQARRRLELLGRERTRLQRAVQRLGEALAARLDLDALTSIVLHGSIEALDADAGCLTLTGLAEPLLIEIPQGNPAMATLMASSEQASSAGRPSQLERDGTWALALPFGFAGAAERADGAIAVARTARPFRADERAVMEGLVDRAREAAADIVAHQVLREQAFTDSLTALGNRRKLAADLEARIGESANGEKLVLVLFDLDGFKGYNDTFGHLAGDALLARLGGKLSAAVASAGCAYRLGGDEFCVLVGAPTDQLEAIVGRAAEALIEHGENFTIGSSYGTALMPEEADNLDYAVQLADQRMYARKRGRSAAGDQARDVLLSILASKQPALGHHCSAVADLCVRVGRRLQLHGEQLDELRRAAELHDIGKVGIPEAIIDKPGALDEAEWDFNHRHTLIGEHILSAAPALRPVAVIVRSSHERWDGSGYPDGLAGTAIPLGARVIAACDAYEAMMSDRSYRPRRDHGAACEELAREAGHQFDPDVIAALLPELEEGDPGGRSSRRPVPARAHPSPPRSVLRTASR